MNLEKLDEARDLIIETIEQDECDCDNAQLLLELIKFLDETVMMIEPIEE